MDRTAGLGYDTEWFWREYKPLDADACSVPRLVCVLSFQGLVNGSAALFV